VCLGRETVMHYFSCLGGIGPDSTSALGDIIPIFCFPFGGICGSRSAFWCVLGAKR
jgi:hypothetical protein